MKVKNLILLVAIMASSLIVIGCSSGAEDSVPKEGVNAGKDVPKDTVTPRTRPGEEGGR